MSAWNSASPPTRISVTLAHRDALVRAGLLASLADERDFEVSVLAPDAAAGPPSADVVIADYETAMALLAADLFGLPRHVRAPRVMVVSHRERESEIRTALDSGVYGYLLQGCGIDEVIFGVRALHRGQHHLDRAAAQRVAESLNRQSLTSREDDVLRLIAVGHVNKTIATELGITVGTVKAHVKAILAKFGARTRTEAAAMAQQRGLVGSGT